ncbi:proteoglycan 4-like [Rhineura floridana]|uniref:proteoglycan 4-like n=1 Tax=Rhineura floridana TaxID=261503 RepID=UPI002AC807AE|nr:proteoglycan 4-like [Rhineura floridana]
MVEDAGDMDWLPEPPEILTLEHRLSCTSVTVRPQPKELDRDVDSVLSSLSSTSLDSLTSISSSWSLSSSSEDISLLDTAVSPLPSAPEEDGWYSLPFPRPLAAGLKRPRREPASRRPVQFNIRRKLLEELWGGLTPHLDSLTDLIPEAPNLQQASRGTSEADTSTSSGGEALSEEERRPPQRAQEDPQQSSSSEMISAVSRPLSCPTCNLPTSWEPSAHPLTPPETSSMQGRLLPSLKTSQTHVKIRALLLEDMMMSKGMTSPEEQPVLHKLPFKRALHPCRRPCTAIGPDTAQRLDFNVKRKQIPELWGEPTPLTQSLAKMECQAPYSPSPVPTPSPPERAEKEGRRQPEPTSAHQSSVKTKAKLLEMTMLTGESVPKEQPTLPKPLPPMAHHPHRGPYKAVGPDTAECLDFNGKRKQIPELWGEPTPLTQSLAKMECQAPYSPSPVPTPSPPERAEKEGRRQPEPTSAHQSSVKTKAKLLEMTMLTGESVPKEQPTLPKPLPPMAHHPHRGPYKAVGPDTAECLDFNGKRKQIPEVWGEPTPLTQSLAKMECQAPYSPSPVPTPSPPERAEKEGRRQPEPTSAHQSSVKTKAKLLEMTMLTVESVPKEQPTLPKPLPPMAPWRESQDASRHIEEEPSLAIPLMTSEEEGRMSEHTKAPSPGSALPTAGEEVPRATPPISGKKESTVLTTPMGSAGVGREFRPGQKTLASPQPARQIASSQAVPQMPGDHSRDIVAKLPPSFQGSPEPPSRLQLIRSILTSLSVEQTVEDLRLSLVQALEMGHGELRAEYPVCRLCGSCSARCPHPRTQQDPLLHVYPRLTVRDGHVHMGLGFHLKIKRTHAKKWGLVETVEGDKVQEQPPERCVSIVKPSVPTDLASRAPHESSRLMVHHRHVGTKIQATASSVQLSVQKKPAGNCKGPVPSSMQHQPQQVPPGARGRWAKCPERWPSTGKPTRNPMKRMLRVMKQAWTRIRGIKENAGQHADKPAVAGPCRKPGPPSTMASSYRCSSMSTCAASATSAKPPKQAFSKLDVPLFIEEAPGSREPTQPLLHLLDPRNQGLLSTQPPLRYPPGMQGWPR